MGAVDRYSTGAPWRQLTLDDMYVTLCPELDIASQGSTMEEAKKNLKEKV
ncbi:hypothetical protein DBT_1845 [Dissulfuribacter thermophilus]|uniref:Uncharacterized protein n=1 Tax=Dissulfuribacter thermophilus TaxID=1156395 RepID=A0A1B9F4N8_9BACT|nr:hypothetical protein [Dissulfuribacter thermophilus]OCC14785.1 hypothetical protein DBT_1845 [Dissulfuribacter thermophilus]